MQQVNSSDAVGATRVMDTEAPVRADAYRGPDRTGVVTTLLAEVVDRFDELWAAAEHGI